jgi:hypothetical protein
MALTKLFLILLALVTASGGNADLRPCPSPEPLSEAKLGELLEMYQVSAAIRIGDDDDGKTEREYHLLAPAIKGRISDRGVVELDSCNVVHSRGDVILAFGAAEGSTMVAAG